MWHSKTPSPLKSQLPSLETRVLTPSQNAIVTSPQRWNLAKLCCLNSIKTSRNGSHIIGVETASQLPVELFPFWSLRHKHGQICVWVPKRHTATEKWCTLTLDTVMCFHVEKGSFLQSQTDIAQYWQDDNATDATICKGGASHLSA